MTEAYVSESLLKIAIGLVPIGAFVAAPSKGILLLLSPCIVIGAFGVSQLFFSRKFTFSPRRREVRVDTHSFWGGAKEATFRYSQIGVALEGRWVFGRPIHKRFFAMFSFPGIRVAFHSSPYEAEVEAAIRRLMCLLELGDEEPNKAPEPTTGAVTPRATEGASN